MTTVNTAPPIEETAALFRKYITFPDDRLPFLLALWVVATHFQHTFDYYGYVVITSPQPECGKSVLLNLLRRTAFNCTDPIISPTEATVTRTASGVTQVFDEVDTWINAAYLKPILNSGFERGAKVTRCAKSSRGGTEDYVPKPLDVFAPRAFAGIELQRLLPKTTLTRSFVVPLERRTADERKSKPKRRDLAHEAAAVFARIAEWVSANRVAVSRAYSESPFECLEPFGERTNDIAEPLIAVLRVAYPDAAQRQSPLNTFLGALELTRDEKNTATVDQRVFHELLQLMGTDDEIVGTPTELMAKLRENGVSAIGETDLSATLRRHGLEPASKRLGGGIPLKRYTVTRDWLISMISRYGVSTTAESAADVVMIA